MSIKTVLLVDRSTPFNPETFICKGWAIWRGPIDGDGLKGEEDQDPNALTLTEIDLNNVVLDDGLEINEEILKGEEKFFRLKAKPIIRLDAAILQTLLKKNEMIPDFWKEKLDGETRYIYFYGTILYPVYGRVPCVLCLFFLDDNKWHWGYRWLVHNWRFFDLSAVLVP